MIENKKGTGEAATSEPRAIDGELTQYDSILSELFGQVCTRVLKLNERKDADGFGCYYLSISDACISCYSYKGGESISYQFCLYRPEIERVGLDTALRSLIEVLDGEGDAE